MECKLIVESGKSGATNMATDEYFLNESINKKSNFAILRVYDWNPSCISLGYFQKINNSIDLEYAKANGIDITRRITGGGTVFHDKEITYSLIIPENQIKSFKIVDSYSEILTPIINALNKNQIYVEMSGINDIIVSKSGKKISGSAQTRKRGYILQHGTILLDINFVKMLNLLRIPVEKLNDKKIKSVKERITSIAENNPNLNKENIISTIVNEFESGFGFEYEEKIITEYELIQIKKIAEEKFNSNAWIGKR